MGKEISPVKSIYPKIRSKSSPGDIFSTCSGPLEKVCHEEECTTALREPKLEERPLMVDGKSQPGQREIDRLMICSS